MHKDYIGLGLEANWARDCMKYYGHVLNGKMGHWCWDWDELPVDETCKEFEACSCFEGREE